MTESGGVPRATLEVVCVALGLHDEPRSTPELHTLLVRTESTSPGATWSLPRARVRGDESLEDAARRQLGHAGVSARTLEQLRAICADVDGERIVTIAYYGFVNVQERSTTSSIGEFSVGALPALPPHHGDLVIRAITRVRETTRWTMTRFDPAPYSRGDDSEIASSREGMGILDFLPARFSLTHLQRLYEAIEGTSLDKRNFRKKVLATGLLIATDDVEQGVRHRAAKLYRFDRRKYDRQVKQSVLGCG